MKIFMTIINLTVNLSIVDKVHFSQSSSWEILRNGFDKLEPIFSLLTVFFAHYKHRHNNLHHYCLMEGNPAKRFRQTGARPRGNPS